MRRHPRRAEVDPEAPSGWGTSDRNGMISNHRKLRWQYEWAGTQLINKRILVSEDELDEPQRQLGTIFLPPDPVPLTNARPEQYAIEEMTFLISQTGQQLYAQDGVTALLGDNLQGLHNAGTYPG